MTFCGDCRFPPSSLYSTGVLAKGETAAVLPRSLYSAFTCSCPTCRRRSYLLDGFSGLVHPSTQNAFQPQCVTSASSPSLGGKFVMMAHAATQHLRTVHVISFHTVSTVLVRISPCQSLISYFTGLRFVTYLGKEPAVVITQGLAIIALTQN